MPTAIEFHARNLEAHAHNFRTLRRAARAIEARRGYGCFALEAAWRADLLNYRKGMLLHGADIARHADALRRLRGRDAIVALFDEVLAICDEYAEMGYEEGVVGKAIGERVRALRRLRGMETKR